jgi:hypothetical protein
MTRLAALTLAVALAAFAQDAPQIQGRVLDDRDAPVAGAVVFLIGGPMPGTHTAITTDEGRFAWTGVAPATYSMSVTKPGYPAIRYGQSRPNGPGLPIEIVAGRRMNLDVRLPRGAVIAGRVLDDAGDPVSGRPIVLSRPATPASPTVKGVYQASNARGQYRIFGLPAGTYAVGAALPQRSGNERTPPAGSVTVTVAAGDERDGVDLRAQAAGQTTYVTVRPLATNGQPLRLPQVKLRRQGDARAAFSYGTRNADGSTTIADVPAGQYKAVVEAGSSWGAADVLVDGEHPAAVTVSISPGVRVRGQVTLEGSSRPPARLSVQAVPADIDGVTDEGSSLTAQAAADGSFAIPGVPPGRYLLRELRWDSDTWTVQSARIGDIDAADVPLVVGTGEVTGIAVTMTDTKTLLRGRVTSPAGAVNGADVIAYPADAKLRTHNSRRVAAAKTGLMGQYELRGLPAGDYLLAIEYDVDPEAIKDPAVLAKLTAAAAFTLARGETREQNVAIK